MTLCLAYWTDLQRARYPLLAARGYPSVAVLREFTIQAINPAVQNGQAVIILHLGDHDPSGLDMTCDLEDRLALFVLRPVTLHRIALNLDQIREINPTENPAKTRHRRLKSSALENNRFRLVKIV